MVTDRLYMNTGNFGDSVLELVVTLSSSSNYKG